MAATFDIDRPRKQIWLREESYQLHHGQCIQRTVLQQLLGEWLMVPIARVRGDDLFECGLCGRPVFDATERGVG